MDLKKWIRDVPDYPSEGVLFRDLTPLLADPVAFEFTVTGIVEQHRNRDLDAVVAIDARGFLFGAPVALALSLPLVPFRKPKKLPPEVIGVDFELEYARARLEARSDSLRAGMSVLIVDDLLATGGTAVAALRLIEQLGASVDALAFVVELTDLNGRQALDPHEVTSLVRY